MAAQVLDMGAQGSHSIGAAFGCTGASFGCTGAADGLRMYYYRYHYEHYYGFMVIVILVLIFLLLCCVLLLLLALVIVSGKHALSVRCGNVLVHTLDLLLLITLTVHRYSRHYSCFFQ